MSYFIWLEMFIIKERLLYYLQNMCYSKNSLKSSFMNDVQIILQLRVLGLIENLSRGLGRTSFTVIANVRLIP